MADEKEAYIQIQEDPTNEGVPNTFPVIGIGASAGGLEALNALFEKMPEDTGAAFVVVQHLAPTKESSMPELLGRRTRLPVHQVTDNTRLEPNTIYLIPPDKNMSIVNGTLQLLDFARSPGLRHPIDFFFKTLAQDRREAAVGIIMSGTGTDGTEGARFEISLPLKANRGRKRNRRR
jgi:two-component system, chemotaxis family, CheB/CheR fusion protein